MGPTIDFGSFGGGIAGPAALAFIWALAITIFWMVVGWRAMKAHERLADATERLSKKQDS